MNQSSVKVETLLETPFPDRSPDVLAGANVGQEGAEMYRDLLKVLMSVSDGLEREGDPFDSERPGSKNYTSEPRPLGKIERTRPWLV